MPQAHPALTSPLPITTRKILAHQRQNSDSPDTPANPKAAETNPAGCAYGATTIRDRRDEWIKAGIFGQLKTIARDAYDRIAALALRDIAVDGCIAKAPGAGTAPTPARSTAGNKA